MKKLFTALLLTTLMTQAFAGILENKRTGESVELILNRAAQEVEVISSASGLFNKVIKIHDVKASHYKTKTSFKMLPVTNATLEHIYDIRHWSIESYSEARGLSFVIPIFNIPALTAFSVDIVAIPVRATIKLFEVIGKSIKDSINNKRSKKDFYRLMKLINTQETIKVSDKKFRRTIQLLN